MAEKRKIKKAVIPAAGYGTRFLPASKSQPKEMLPIVDTPTIQFVVEEAVASGISDILMIIGKGKRTLEEYFDRNYELENDLKKKGKQNELKQIRRISEIANIHFIWQKEMRGLGDAILHAKYHVNDEPFAVLLGDTVIKAKKPATKQLIEIYEQYGKSVLGLEQVEKKKVSRYGIISANKIQPKVLAINDIIEKPEVSKAPSSLAICGRYLLMPEIFRYIEKTKKGKGNEIQLTDALKLMLQAEKIYGRIFDGKRYDIGNKLDFIKTNIEFGLEKEDIKDELLDYIKYVIKGRR